MREVLNEQEVADILAAHFRAEGTVRPQDPIGVQFSVRLAEEGGMAFYITVRDVPVTAGGSA